MSGEIPERVTCEVCGTSFDPRESRGWCPNEACGKWQHPSFPLSDGAAGRGAADGGVNAPTKVCPSCGKDVRADANFCKFCSHEFPDEPTQEPASGGDPGLDACPDCGADLSSIPPDRLADCPICGTDLSGVLADQTEPDVTPADLTDCPACQADLTNIPADMRMVCPDCRVDLREAIQTHGVGDGTAGAGGGGGAGGAAGGQAGTGGAGAGAGAGGGAGGQTGGQQAGGGTGDEAGDSGAGGGLLDGTTDPDSGAAAESVDTIKGIGASYADRLADAGVRTVGDLVRADPAELSAATDISEKRLGEWVERAPVDAADVGGVAGETDAAAGGQAGAGGGQGGQQTGGDAGAGSQSGAGGQAGQGAQSGTGGQTGQGAQSGAGGQAGQGGRASSGESGRASSGQGAGGGQGTTGGRQGGRNQPSVPGSSSGGGQAGGQGGAGGQAGGQGGAGGATGGRQGGQNQPSVPGASGGGQGSRAGQAQPHYNTVVFEVMGQEIRASSGDTIGREIRTAMVEGGAPDDDAVYVHREHLRVDQEGETFYLVRLGQNSLKINGTPVGQHERAQVTDGDEVSFSEVVTADVKLE